MPTHPTTPPHVTLSQDDAKNERDFGYFEYEVTHKANDKLTLLFYYAGFEAYVEGALLLLLLRLLLRLRLRLRLLPLAPLQRLSPTTPATTTARRPVYCDTTTTHTNTSKLTSPRLSGTKTLPPPRRRAWTAWRR